VGAAHRFGWKRVSILYTDTQWKSRHRNVHGLSWEGKVAGTHSISVQPNGDLDQVSLRQVRA
jgi:hypothetical protein